MNRPLVYFDQNMLVDPMEALIQSRSYEGWKRDIIIAYSDETISEIIRSTGLEDRILDNFDRFDTVRVHRKMIGFTQTNRYGYTPQTPKQRYYELKDDPWFNSAKLKGLDHLHKMFGGASGKTYNDISSEQMNELKNILSTELKNLGLSDECILELTALLPDKSMNIDEALLTPNQADMSSTPALEFQRAITKDAQKLNTITDDNIVERVWELICKSAKDLPYRDINELFPKYGTNPITGEPYTIPELTNIIMLMLNMIGYFPDKKLRKSQPFISSASDLGHASWGTLCSAVVTRDINFRQRLKATYQYLKLETCIFDVDLTNEFELVDFWLASA